METQQILKQAVPLLLQWYARNKRALPWREAPSPYCVWISEIMLQQTRIEAVIPYYRRFLAELPNVQALASLPEDRLMKLWEGLGYYSRARNLQKAAKMMTEQYGGELPRSAEELKKLPGIGEYTAGAIASIAYGQPEPAVDGNVLRVIMRLTACSADIALPKTKRDVTADLRAVYPAGKQASALTQALMELGEVICLPNAKPLCQSCPVASVCAAYAGGNPQQYPVVSPKKPRRVQQKTVFLLRCRGKYALLKRGNEGLLAGLWEFPNAEGFLNEREATRLLNEWGLNPLDLRPCGNAKHIFTHIEWHMRGYTVECAEQGGDFIWKSGEEIARQTAIPTAFRHFLKQI